MHFNRSVIVGWFFVIFVGVLFAPSNSHAATTKIAFDSPRGGEVYALGQTRMAHS